MSKLLEGAKWWLSCLVSSYKRLCRVVGWETEGRRRGFLFFPTLCIHLAAYDYSPLCYWETSIPSCGHLWTHPSPCHCIWQFNQLQDFHHCFKSRDLILQSIMASAVLRVQVRLPQITQHHCVRMVPFPVLHPERDASCLSPVTVVHE